MWAYQKRLLHAILPDAIGEVVEVVEILRGFLDFQITVLDLSNFGLHLEQGLNTDVDTRSVAEVDCDRPVLRPRNAKIAETQLYCPVPLCNQ